MAKKPEADDETSTGSQVLQSILAVRVREARRKSKLKQSELATLIGSSQSFVFLVEAADANLTIKSLVKIAEALKTDPVQLLMSKETASLFDKNKTKQLSDLVQLSLQEIQTTTNNLAKVNDYLQQIHELLGVQEEKPDASPPPQD